MTDYPQAALTVLFLLIALGIAFGALFQILRPFLKGKLSMKADKTDLVRGETVRVEIEVPQNLRRLEVILKAEEMYETFGKRIRVYGHAPTIYTETVYQDSRQTPGS